MRFININRVISILVACAVAFAALSVPDISLARSHRSGKGHKAHRRHSLSHRIRAPRRVRAVGGDGYINVHWKRVKRATGYILYKNGTRLARLHGRNDNFYNDPKAAGKTATYRVRSVGRNGRVSRLSAKASASGKAVIPTIRRLTKKRIFWFRSRGACSYRVYKVGKNKKLSFIGETKRLSYPVNAKKRSATFAVKAVAWNGRISDADTSFSRKYRSRHNRKVKFLMDGDSQISLNYSWAKRSARMMGFKWKSRAVRGSKIIRSSTISLYRRSMRLGFKGYDVVLFRIGSNDYSGDSRLGNMHSTDPGTFYGAYKAVIRKVRRDAPNAKIILVTPVEKRVYQGNFGVFATRYSNYWGDNLKDYQRAVRRLAKRYHCLLFDQARSGIVTRSNIHYTLRDHRHPTALTHIKMSNMFNKFLISHGIAKIAG